MNAHLDRHATEAYARGEHPIDHAQMRLRTMLELYAAEQLLPPHTMAGFVLAELLKAGWTPPGDIFPDAIPDSWGTA